MPEETPPEATPTSRPITVTRTYRAAVRLGEDFVTLEETITLPLDASDAELEQAVALGWRIYSAQHAALESQVAELRAARGPSGGTAGSSGGVTIRNPYAPATERQRQLIASLQHDLDWNEERLTEFASEQGVELIDLSRGQASHLIDVLKERQAAWGQGKQANAAQGSINDEQQQALRNLAATRGEDLATAVQQRFGCPLEELSGEQAGALITEWQRRGGR
jgi:hypothetical protein